MNRDKERRKIYFNALRFMLCTMLFTLCSMRSALCADAPASIKEGNSLYRQGKYDEALKYYNEAEVDMPDSDVVSFNKGAALYQKGDYEKAIEAFSKALLSDNSGIEEKAAYNIGNSKYRLGRLKVNTDLASAVNLYREALDYYKRAIELNQDNTNAKYNHEFVEKELKILLDKLKQQSSSAKASEDKQEQAEQESQQKEKEKQQQAQATASEQEEKEQEEKEQEEKPLTSEMSRAQGDEEKQGKQEEEAQEQAKGYQPQEGQEEMSEEEARMILDRYAQQDESIGNMGRGARRRRYPRVLKDW